MKLKIGIVVTILAVIAAVSGRVVELQSNTVAEFRAAIDYRFTRLQAFYDATNNAMNMYRYAHVESIHVN